MLFYDDVFWEALWHTLIVIASGPLGIVMALGIALLVNAEIRGREIYRTIVFLSYPLMTVAVGIIWRWMYDERVGLFNYVLRSLGIIDQPIPFLQSFAWALPSGDPRQSLAGDGLLHDRPADRPAEHSLSNLYEAAAIDGAPRCAQFRRITLPLLRPSIFLCFVIGMLNSFTSFDLVWIMTGGGPGHATELLVTWIYKQAFQQTPVRLCGGRDDRARSCCSSSSPGSPTACRAARRAP